VSNPLEISKQNQSKDPTEKAFKKTTNQNQTFRRVVKSAGNIKTKSIKKTKQKDPGAQTDRIQLGRSSTLYQSRNGLFPFWHPRHGIQALVHSPTSFVRYTPSLNYSPPTVRAAATQHGRQRR
jgi:hypothetical protein